MWALAYNAYIQHRPLTSYVKYDREALRVEKDIIINLVETMWGSTTVAIPTQLTHP